jgi:hypothetical protein
MKKYFQNCLKCGVEGEVTENAGNNGVEYCVCGHVWDTKDILESRPTRHAADVCHSCGSKDFAAPDRMGISFCLMCGTRR